MAGVIAMTTLDEEEIRRERLVRIDQLLADHDRKRQEIAFAPWQLVLAGVTAAAALMTVGAAFTIAIATVFKLL
jgi:hypothetical protein